MTVPPIEARTMHHNLPAQLNSFVGREQAIIDLAGLLTNVRPITLTGEGGCGKTRLALELAAGVLDAFSDGVWLVELAALDEPAFVPSLEAAALGMCDQTDTCPPETLIRALEPRDLLLVLDNCEHLIDASAELVQCLLRACPRLHVLATSRQSLGIPGETSGCHRCLYPLQAPPVRTKSRRVRPYVSSWIVLAPSCRNSP